jgi:hypothetical protein
MTHIWDGCCIGICFPNLAHKTNRQFDTLCSTESAIYCCGIVVIEQRSFPLICCERNIAKVSLRDNLEVDVSGLMTQGPDIFGSTYFSYRNDVRYNEAGRHMAGD